MLDNIIKLTPTQKILYYSAMISIIIQIISIYCLMDSKENFKIYNSFFYLFFSSISYLFYYKIILH